MLRVLSVAVVSGSLLLATAARVQDWTSERRLWTSAVAVSPLKPRPWINLGNAYSRLGSDGLAAYAYRTARDLARARTGSERSIGEGIAVANLALMAVERGDLAGAKVLLVSAPGLPATEAMTRWLERQSSP